MIIRKEAVIDYQDVYELIRQAFDTSAHSTGIETVCDKAKDMGYQAVFLCGNFYYYTRFGFTPTYEYEIYHIDDSSKDAQWCMVKELVNGYLNGISGSIDIL